MAKTKVAEKKVVVPAVKTTKEFKIGSKTIIVSNEDLICTGLLFVLVFIVHSIRTNFAGIPFERDEGIYSYFGKLVLRRKSTCQRFLRGEVPRLVLFLCYDRWLIWRYSSRNAYGFYVGEYSIDGFLVFCRAKFIFSCGWSNYCCNFCICVVNTKLKRLYCASRAWSCFLY